MSVRERERDDSFIRRKKGINSSMSHCALSLFNFFILHLLYHILCCHNLIFRYYSNIYYTLTKEQNLIISR